MLSVTSCENRHRRTLLWTQPSIASPVAFSSMPLVTQTDSDNADCKAPANVGILFEALLMAILDLVFFLLTTLLMLPACSELPASTAPKDALPTTLVAGPAPTSADPPPLLARSPIFASSWFEPP